MEARDCESIGSIHAGGELELYNSKVTRNIETPSTVKLEGSEVSGVLETCAPICHIKRSSLNKIIFKPAFSLSGFSSGGMTFVGSGYISNVFIGGTHFSGDCVINGVSVRDLMRQQASNNSEANIKQTLELDDSTVRDVTFENCTGEVLLKNGAKVTGSVFGGEIIG